MKENIKTVFDFNDVVTDMLDNFIEGFISSKGLTREPTEEDYDDFGHNEIGWMYTQKGMALYNRACKRYTNLGEKLFPNNIHDLDIKAMGMLFP